MCADTTNTELTAERIAQVNSVLRVVEDAMTKLKVSLVLPRIFENPITIRQCLAGTQYEGCLELIALYTKERKQRRTIAPELNYTLLKIIDMFHVNYKMLDLLPNWFEDLSVEDHDLLAAFSLLHSITKQRLHKSALSELDKEKKIHHIYHENEHMKRNILEFQNKLRNQRINLRWKLAAKDGVIMKYEEDLAFKKWDNNVRIKQEITKSSRLIRNIQNASVIKQKELEEELEKAKVNYEKVLKQNLQQEKEARSEKNKLLLQLQSLIKKFDQNIGEKMKENMALQERYDEQKKEFDEFLVEYQREELEYENVVVRKELEDKQKHEERLMLFMMNRAARIIQRWWRRLQRDLKKKAKKTKGAAKGKGKGKK